jgi:hypothetical protein
MARSGGGLVQKANSTFASTLHAFARVCKAGYRTECSYMYRTKGLCWLFLETYVRLSNCREAISEGCFFNRFCYQVVARFHLPQTVNISSTLITTMEAPIGTNSATRFKDGISRNAASILKAN